MHYQGHLTEQLWMIGVTGAYAGAIGYQWALTQFFNERTPLSTVVPWIQHLAFAAGVLLFIAFVARSVWLWRSVGAIMTHEHAHQHGHPHHHHHTHHHHAHDHEHVHDHDHHHAHGPHHHDHVHDHVHEHAHGHGEGDSPDHGRAVVHSHGDAHEQDHGHEHDWSPWRFVVLLFPIFLVVLPLPWPEMIENFDRRRMHIGEVDVELVMAPPAGETVAPYLALAFVQDPVARSLAVLAYAPPPEDDKLATLSAVLNHLEELNELAGAGPAVRTDVAELERIALRPDLRQHWKNIPRVEVEGIFSPHQAKGRFSLVRLRRACCVGDARPSYAFGFTRRESLGVQPGEWVRVVGRVVDFTNKTPDHRWRAVIKASNIVRTKQPSNPYID